MNQALPSSDTVQYDRHKITNVRFISRTNFFIDNLAFARSTVQSELLMCSMEYHFCEVNCLVMSS